MAQETSLRQYLHDLGVHAFDRSSNNRKIPIYGTVKDLLRNARPFEASMVPRMIKDVHEYHKHGIFMGDVREENYRDGIFFDLSRAKTVPHPELTRDIVDKLIDFRSFTGEIPRLDDERMDTMIDDWNARHAKEGRFIWKRMRPNRDFRDKFRTSKKEYRAIRYAHPKYRPELFDWINLKAVKEVTMVTNRQEWCEYWTGDRFHPGRAWTEEDGRKLMAKKYSWKKFVDKEEGKISTEN